MSKRVILFFVMILCIALCACGKNTQAKTTQVVNPLREVTVEELETQTGIALVAPEGAAEVRYFVLAYGDVKIAQVKFSWNGQAAYVRAQETSALEAEDISGLNYQWTSTGETQVGDCKATTYVKDGVGYIAWLDGESGIVYNLCMTEGANADTLCELANAIFKLIS